jgi:hypothetical protein
MILDPSQLTVLLNGTFRFSLFVCLVIPFSALGQSVELVEGITMGASSADVVEAASRFCESHSVIHAEAVRYPLAGDSEEYVICEGYSGGPLGFERAAFVLADDRLSQVEAFGVGEEELNALMEKPDGEYLGMVYFGRGSVWLDAGAGRMTWLTESALHPNLFAWSVPQLSETAIEAIGDSTEIPVFIDFNASLDALEPAFERNCSGTARLESHNPWLPNGPDTQVQIDCFGVPFGGFPRKFELVFGDGNLQVIWVLTGKPEQERMLELLRRDWGEPDLVNDGWEVFGGGRISLRKDKPEFLILSEEMIPFYQDTFTAE